VRRKAIYAAVVMGALATLGIAISSYAIASSARTVVTSDPMSGYLEGPPGPISSDASGTFTATIDDSTGNTDSPSGIHYVLTYTGLTSGVTQAHIHFGQRSVSGGISAFLCTNIGGPPGTPECPSPSGTVTGTITTAQVIGPTAQGIAPGELAELVRAIRAGRAYANVHSTAFPGGEIRGQINDQDQLDN
jgi:hypothetical protein